MAGTLALRACISYVCFDVATEEFNQVFHLQQSSKITSKVHLSVLIEVFLGILWSVRLNANHGPKLPFYLCPVLRFYLLIPEYQLRILGLSFPPESRSLSPGEFGLF